MTGGTPGTGGATGGFGGAGGSGGADCAELAEISYRTEWETGYCADVILSNPGPSATTTWSVVFDLNGATVSESWRATFSATSGRVTVTALDYNAVIQPGSSTDFGFCSNVTDGGPGPTIVQVSGIEGCGDTDGSGDAGE